MKIIKQDLHTEVYFAGEWCISWNKNNLCHREDGPAAMWNIDGYFRDRFWLRGIHYYMEEYYVKIRLE